MYDNNAFQCDSLTTVLAAPADQERPCTPEPSNQHDIVWRKSSALMTSTFYIRATSKTRGFMITTSVQLGQGHPRETYIFVCFLRWEESGSVSVVSQASLTRRVTICTGTKFNTENLLRASIVEYRTRYVVSVHICSYISSPLRNISSLFLACVYGEFSLDLDIHNFSWPCTLRYFLVDVLPSLPPLPNARITVHHQYSATIIYSLFSSAINGCWCYCYSCSGALQIRRRFHLFRLRLGHF